MTQAPNDAAMAALVLRAQAGDERAFTELVNHYRTRLNASKRLMRPELVAE